MRLLFLTQGVEQLLDVICNLLFNFLETMVAAGQVAAHAAVAMHGKGPEFAESDFGLAALDIFDDLLAHGLAAAGCQFDPGFPFGDVEKPLHRCRHALGAFLDVLMEVEWDALDVSCNDAVFPELDDLLFDLLFGVLPGANERVRPLARGAAAARRR